jgi:hypothetical protein
MINDVQLTVGVNVVGLAIFALVFLYHYVSINEADDATKRAEIEVKQDSVPPEMKKRHLHVQ